jgi:O-antigen/teichoic acid export membrane protein
LSTRFAFQALGVDAFGVYTATAGLPLMLGFITGAMSVATQRMLVTGLIDTAMDRQRLFNACLGPHLTIALVLALVGETLGTMMLDHALRIPADMHEQARIVLHVNVAAMALGALLAPYEALLQARERFALFAGLEILRACTVLAGSYWLLDYSGDRLVGYAFVQTVAAAGVALLGAGLTARQWPEARLRPSLLVDRSELRRRWSLFSWTIFGSLAVTARNQGFAVLANVFFGPTASAAFGVGNQILGALRQLSTAVSQAVAPRIYKIEASGERSRMVETALLASKYSSLIAAILAVPLLLELNTVLLLWLGSVPDNAEIVVIILASAFLLDQLSFSSGVAHLAIGHLARYQLVCGLIAISALPIGYVVGDFGGGISTILSILVATSGAVAVMRVVLLESYAPGVTMDWVLTTIAPSVLGFGTGLLAGYGVVGMAEPGLFRVVMTTAASTAALLAAICIAGLSPLEKRAFRALLPRPLSAS